MVLMKQDLLPVTIAKTASFGLVNGKPNTRWECAHMYIFQVSMEILPVLLECLRDAYSPAEIYHLFPEVSLWKVKS